MGAILSPSTINDSADFSLYSDQEYQANVSAGAGAPGVSSSVIAGGDSLDYDECGQSSRYSDDAAYRLEGAAVAVAIGAVAYDVTGDYYSSTTGVNGGVNGGVIGPGVGGGGGVVMGDDSCLVAGVVGVNGAGSVIKSRLQDDVIQEEDSYHTDQECGTSSTTQTVSAEHKGFITYIL